MHVVGIERACSIEHPSRSVIEEEFLIRRDDLPAHPALGAADHGQTASRGR
jgi:hypothetical protein